MSQICNLCGGELVSRLPQVQDTLTNESFAISVCSSCGLGHTLPQPENLGRYYGPVYYGNRHSFTNRFCMNRRIRFVSSATKKSSGKRLLDIGCGDGSFLYFAKDAGWDVMGTELNPERALQAGFDVKETLEQIPEEQAFDCITMWHTLEHMRDVKWTLAEATKRLTTDGKLIIAVPDYGGLQAKLFGRKWLHLDVPRHLYHFDAHSLSNGLRNAGFRIEKQWHQEFEYDLMGWTQSALNYIFSTPNIFMNVVMGKRDQTNVGSLLQASNFILGAIVTGLFLPAVAVGTLFRRGGTLIIVASREI